MSSSSGLVYVDSRVGMGTVEWKRTSNNIASWIGARRSRLAGDGIHEYSVINTRAWHRLGLAIYVGVFRLSDPDQPNKSTFDNTSSPRKPTSQIQASYRHYP